MEIFKNKPFVVLAAVFVFAVLIVGGGYWYFYSYRPKQLLKSFQNEYQKGIDAQQTGDLNASITAFNESLKNAPGDLGAARRKINIASLEFKRNEGSDRANAAAIYREILADNSLPASYRASAVDRLMVFLYASRDEKFAKEEIFKGEPLASFLKEGDVWLAERRAYELSNELFPSPVAVFQIADWYRMQLLENNNLGRATKVEYLAKFKELTQKGESLLSLTVSQNYSKSRAAFAYMLAGIEKGGIAELSGGKYNSAENNFMRALVSLGDTSKDAEAYGVAFFVRFNYASMLAETFGSKRLSDIKSLLKSVISPPPPQFKSYPFSFYEFLKNEADGQYEDRITRKQIILLSTLVPEFKSFLDSRGLKYE